jgi:hypothetical protein
MGVKLGLDAKLYYDEKGIDGGGGRGGGGSPAWN